MSHPGNEELKENLFEFHYDLLINSGWHKNAWETIMEARERADNEWAERS
jgi:hypothetical protein